MRKPKITKEIKEQSKKIEELKYDSTKETMYDYVERISKERKTKKP